MKKRTDKYLELHGTIMRALTAYIDEHGTIPSYRTLAKVTGISKSAIHKHLDEVDMDFVQDSLFKTIGHRMLISLSQRAIATGDPKSVELYYKLVFGWKPGLDLTSEGEAIRPTTEIVLNLPNEEATELINQAKPRVGSTGEHQADTEG